MSSGSLPLRLRKEQLTFTLCTSRGEAPWSHHPYNSQDASLATPTQQRPSSATQPIYHPSIYLSLYSSYISTTQPLYLIYIYLSIYSLNLSWRKHSFLVTAAQDPALTQLRGNHRFGQQLDSEGACRPHAKRTHACAWPSRASDTSHRSTRLIDSGTA